jgi:D-alanine transaminase
MQQVAYLNNQFLPLEDARISPLDRGFLFGDGVYEVIPSYSGKFVGFQLHIQRLQRNLDALEIPLDWNTERWFTIASRLLEENGSGNLGIYLHVSRGADVRRFHGYGQGLMPTVFAYAFEITSPKVADRNKVDGLSVVTQEDIRWQQCHIKSTALLGNVMHFQHAYNNEAAETILYNRQGEITEASTSNIFVVTGKKIATPPLDNQLLPGITRHIVLDIIRTKTDYVVEEISLSLDDLCSADEVWLTSASKELAPVIMIDDQAIADGQIGDIWLDVMSYYAKNKFIY